jgi:hypothetical protein
MGISDESMTCLVWKYQIWHVWSAGKVGRELKEALQVFLIYASKGVTFFIINICGKKFW